MVADTDRGEFVKGIWGTELPEKLGFKYVVNTVCFFCIECLLFC